jgi:hypothetical protein
MSVQIIISQAGPLPISATFNAPSDAPIVLEVTGSVWSEYANLMVGIGIDLDGNQIGTAQIFANPSTTHMAVVPAYITIQIADEGQHTINLFRISGETESDTNDFYNAVLHF